MFGDMFEGLASTGIDTYFDRMEKVMKIKKLCLEVDEPKLNESFTKMLKTLVEATTEELKKHVEKSKKETSNGNS